MNDEVKARVAGKLIGRLLKSCLDDVFLLIGCLLILAGTYILSPVAVLFVAGGMCIAAGVLIGLGNGRAK